MANARLYPPVISGTLPAFTGTTLVVPFALNRAVSKNDIGGFALKLKTVQGEALLAKELTDHNETQLALSNLQVEFNLPVSLVENRFKIGQYFKVQLAFRDKSSYGVVGYYSTVGIIKYTAEPEVTILNAETLDNNAVDIPLFKQYYVGKYEQIKDVTETVYQYIFELYDKKQQLVYTSDWLLHNSDFDNASNNIITALRESTDIHKYPTSLIPYEKYYLRYGVKTVNGLIRYSPLYPVQEIDGVIPNLKADLIAENDFVDSFIKLTLNVHSGELPVTRGTYILLRNDITQENGYNWKQIQYITFSPKIILKNWSFQDFTVEQGHVYEYALQQYNDKGIYSSKIISNSVECDFEDMFLFDGERQLKMRFDPKVASFKIDRLEQKTDTIGSKYPYFFRNGRVEYREFPISAKISYLTDENHYFMTYQELKLNEPTSFYRQTTPSVQDVTQYRIPTTNKVAYNFFAEREFKMKVLEWLGNGKPKLFKSPGEGNYIVRLMNISLTPDDKTQRLIHSFTSTAYEIAEVTYENLLEYGFIESTVPNEKYTAYKTEKFTNEDGSFKYSKTEDIKINSKPILGTLAIKDLLPGDISNDNGGFMGDYLIAKWTDENGVEITDKIVIGKNGALQINVDKDTVLPDIYIPAGKKYYGSITYQYESSVVNTFNLIKNISLVNQISTFVSTDDTINILDDFANNIRKETLEFISLDFYPKEQLEVYSVARGGSNYAYFLDAEFTKPLFYLEKTKVYFVHNYYMYNNEWNYLGDFYAIGNGDNTAYRVEKINNSFWVNKEEFKNKAYIHFPRGNYNQLIIGNGIVLNAVYLSKIITYTIEDTDEELISLADTYGKDSDIYLTTLEKKLSEIETQMKEDA